MKVMATLALLLALAAGGAGAYVMGVLVRVFPPPAFARAPHNPPRVRGQAKPPPPQPKDAGPPLAARVAAASPAAWLAVAFGGLLGVLAVMPLVTPCLLAGLYLSAMQRQPRRDVRR